MIALMTQAEKSGWFDHPPEAQKAGLLVVYAPLSVEKWMKKSGGEGKLTLNPLEGIPNVQPELLTRVKRDFGDDNI